MYAAGIPVGLLVDSRGPRPLVLLGGLGLGIGYLLLHRGAVGAAKFEMTSDGVQAYETGASSVSLPWLCVFSCVTGVGGSAAFSAAIKTCKILIDFLDRCSLSCSCSKLARTSWHCNGLPARGIWAQCIFLLLDIFDGV